MGERWGLLAKKLHKQQRWVEANIVGAVEMSECVERLHRRDPTITPLEPRSSSLLGARAVLNQSPSWSYPTGTIVVRPVGDGHRRRLTPKEAECLHHQWRVVSQEYNAAVSLYEAVCFLSFLLVGGSVCFVVIC